MSFGSYLREERLKTGKSLRAVAAHLGISYVFLGEVERGVRPVLAEKHWRAVCEAIPTVTPKDLAHHAKVTRPIQLSLSELPPKYQQLGLAFIRRIEDQDLDDGEIKVLLRILEKDDE